MSESGAIVLSVELLNELFSLVPDVVTEFELLKGAVTLVEGSDVFHELHVESFLKVSASERAEHGGGESFHLKWCLY